MSLHLSIYRNEYTFFQRSYFTALRNAIGEFDEPANSHIHMNMYISTCMGIYLSIHASMNIEKKSIFLPSRPTSLRNAIGEFDESSTRVYIYIYIYIYVFVYMYI